MPDNNEITFKVSGNATGKRLDHFLNQYYPDKTRSFFTKKIKENKILVNNQHVKPGYVLNENDFIKILFDPPTNILEPLSIDLDIIFEDDDIIVLNKPPGIVVHPGKGTLNNTLVNALLAHTKKLARIDFSDRPGIVHRLDKNTSGLLVIAKTENAYNELRKQFDIKKISRIYWALVWGIPGSSQGTIETFLNRSKRDPTKISVAKSGKRAVTHFKIIQKYSYFSLLELELETGRTHQIRVHLNNYGNPVFADPDYNGRDKQLNRLPNNLKKRVKHILAKVPHQLLHAKKLEFIHPQTKKTQKFECDIPEIFKVTLKKIEELSGV